MNKVPSKIAFLLKVDSARYGIITAYVTNQNIKKNEELFIDYGPKYMNLLEKPSNPQTDWYYTLWKRFKQLHSDQRKYILEVEHQNRIAIEKGLFLDL